MFRALIDTQRLHLRPLRESDAQAIFDRWARDPACTRYLSWATHTSIDQTHEFLRHNAERRREAKEITWGICTGDHGGPWGSISVRPNGHRVELGYVLSRQKWGRGLMTEAARAVLQAIWEVDSVVRVDAHCVAGNVASERVMQKIGMRLEGTLRSYERFPNLGERPQDLRVYAAIRGHA